MATLYQTWKNLLRPAFLSLAIVVFYAAAWGSLLWKVTLVGVGLLAVAYIVEEVVWDTRGRGRPCPACGQSVRLKSFRVRNSCPHCGGQL